MSDKETQLIQLLEYLPAFVGVILLEGYVQENGPLSEEAADMVRYIFKEKEGVG